MLTHSYTKTLLFILGIFLGLFLFGAQAAEATYQNVTGWGWSDTVGWLSMSCENEGECASGYYQVTVDDTTGDITGYGLFNPADTNAIESGNPSVPPSHNIGYVSFGPFGKLTSPVYPTGAGTVGQSATVDIASGDPANDIPANVIGWARACSIFTDGCVETNTGGVYGANLKPVEERGGWDGWISMGGTGYGVTLDLETGLFSGYAWGGDVVGWIDFGNVVTDPFVEDTTPDLTITADPIYVNSPAGNGGVNDTTDLTWSTVAANYNLCQGDSPQLVTGWHGTSPTPPAPGVPETQTGVEVPASVTTYRIRCSEDSGTTWTPWVSVDVQYADLSFDFANGANCVNPTTDTVTLEYGTTNPNFVSCTATSTIAGTGNPTTGWNGPVATVPTPGNSPVTYAADVSNLGSAANLPITFGIQCTDGTSLFPPNGPLEIEATSMCSGAAPTFTLIAAPSDCTDALPGTTTLVLEAFDATFDRCYASSNPSVAAWTFPPSGSGLDIGGALVPGIPQSFPNIPVTAIPHRYTARCIDDDTGTVKDVSETVNYICNQPPVVNLMADPDQISVNTATTLQWNNDYAQACQLYTVPTGSGTPSVDGYQLAGNERESGTRSTGLLAESTYFYIVCTNPFGEATAQEIVGVGVDPITLPVNPCVQYPLDAACVGKKPFIRED